MSIEAERSEAGRAGTVVVVAGELDIRTSPQMGREILARLDAGCDRLVVDMAGVEFIDAAGIGVLVGGANAARRAGGNLVLRAPSPAVEWLLDILGLDRTLGSTDFRSGRAGRPRSGSVTLWPPIDVRRLVHPRPGRLDRRRTGRPRRAGRGPADRPAADRRAAGVGPRHRAPGKE